MAFPGETRVIFFWSGSEGGGEGGFGTDHGAARSELSRLRTTGLSAGGQSHRCRLLGSSKSSASAKEQCYVLEQCHRK